MHELNIRFCEQHQATTELEKKKKMKWVKFIHFTLATFPLISIEARTE